VQDLLYRSEYLAGLVAKASDVEAPPGEDLRATLAASPVPRLIQATGTLLHPAHNKDRTSPTPMLLVPSRDVVNHVGPSKRSVSEVRGCIGLTGIAAHGPGTAPPTGNADEHPEAAPAHLGGAAVPMHCRFAWENTCETMNHMLSTVIPKPSATSNSGDPNSGLESSPARLENFKVKLVQGVTEDALGTDHKDTAEMGWRRLASSCVHVEQLTQEGPGDTTEVRMRFAQHLWRLSASCGGMGQATAKIFRRMDGHQGESAAHKFSLMERGTVLVRSEGLDPFHSHALATADLPVQVFKEGHYFEVRVMSLFTSPGRPDRPKQLEPRCRTEGLVVGMTSMVPSSLKYSAKVASAVPRSWCISMNGTYYCADGTATAASTSSATSRPGSHGDSRSGRQAPWRVRGAAQGAPQTARTEPSRCPFPPISLPGAKRRKIPWSASLGEGDTVGMLITPFGGIVVIVNGERQVMIPDAGVPADVDMYPLVEAYNHVKSVQLVAWASPPK